MSKNQRDAGFSFLDFGTPSRNPRPPTLQKFGSAADSERPTARRVPDDLGVVRGIFWGSMIGVLIWAGAFGIWLRWFA